MVRRRVKGQKDTMYVGYHYAQTNTINVNKTCALQQTAGKAALVLNCCS
jgi:hypothetical protein